VVDHVVFLLDTNILSEVMRENPAPQVMENLARYDGQFGIPALVSHELRFGWLRMAAGRRKDAIGRFLQDVVGLLPVLPYDANAARIHAELRLDAERTGQPLPFADGQIAATAIAHGSTLITRNTRDFAAIKGLRLESWF
jgi:tRNA(fMet)-specific endonuclease VapC